MEDVFCEQIVARKKSNFDITKNAITLAGSVFVVSMLFIFSPIIGGFWVLLSAGAVYGSYQLVLMQNIEYEYIVTNSELDIDKIIAKRRRKRLLTTDIKHWEAFGKYQAQNQIGSDCKCQVDACSSINSENNYYAIFNHKTLGKTLIVFSPNEKVLSNIKKYIPSVAYKQ